MAIQTYKIRCQVTLHSYIDGRVLDLTNYIRNLNIQKGLYEPAGHFEIQLLPAADIIGKKNVSWYYRISPMDYVEIRFTRDWDSKEIPVVMRGFVEEVGLSMAVDNEGRPNRVYTISGSDMGKLFQITRIYYLKEVSRDLQLITLPGFEQVQQKYGVQISGTPGEIIEALFAIAQNQLSLIKKTQTAIPEMKILRSATIKGFANKFALSQEDGSIWDLMSFFDNSPWNELFTVDLADAFYLVFRETPWKDYDDGKYIQGVDANIDKYTLGPPVSIEPSSIQRLNLRRSDAEVKNFFFTYPIHNLVDGQTAFKATSIGEVEKEEDLKSNPHLIDHTDKDAGSYRFGFRRFENSCEVFDMEQMISSKNLALELNQALQRAFKYNSAYESGDIVLKGNSNLRPGIYMTFNYHSGVTPEYYVIGVNHELSFVNNQEQFSTTVNVVRGDGYLRTRKALHNADNEQRKALT